MDATTPTLYTILARNWPFITPFNYDFKVEKQNPSPTLSFNICTTKHPQQLHRCYILKETDFWLFPDMLSQHQAASILNALDEQTKTGHLCDVLFYNNSGSVWAHSCVLAGFSPVFDQMFSLNLKNSHHWSLKQPIQITVNNTSMCQSEAISNCIQCLAQVVKFIYTGHIKPNALHLHHLFLLCDRLGNEELFRICEKYRKEHSLLSANVEKNEQSVSEKIISCVDENVAVAATLQGHDVARAEKMEDTTIQRENEDEPSNADCTICHFVSKDQNRFEIHGRIFHCNSYKCFYCGNCYKSISSLLHHMEHECESGSHLICSVCLFESPSSSELLSHMEEHRSFKPFMCPHCKSAYDRRSVWLKHLRIHSLNKMHPCPTCGITFRTATECAKHCKAVHATKKHVCDTCGFTAAFPHLLEKHQAKHRKVLVCDQLNCDFLTSSESQLIRHRSAHNTRKRTMVNKNHECSMCNIKFTLHKNLVRHMKIHECEELKMKCPLCGYETSRTDKFNDHMEFKHDHTQVQNDRISTKDRKSRVHSTSRPSKQESDKPAVGMDLSYSDCITKTQSASRETYSVESFSNKHNTLLMNDEGDISIVNTNEKNSVTLRNIGNLTGSITLDEKTGVLTMNNINSGSVFLNETTGELTYINLENDNYHFNPDSMAQGDNFKVPTVSQLSTEITKLDEVTGEIVKVLPTNEETVAPDQDFDYFDMDVNDDSLDGFDDFDEVLFDVFSENESQFDGVSLRDDPSFVNTSVMPHLDESTGLLTFDENMKNHMADQNETWNTSFTQVMEDDSNGEEAYKLLLDEVTGVLHD